MKIASVGAIDLALNKGGWPCCSFIAKISICVLLAFLIWLPFRVSVFLSETFAVLAKDATGCLERN